MLVKPSLVQACDVHNLVTSSLATFHELVYKLSFVFHIRRNVLIDGGILDVELVLVRLIRVNACLHQVVADFVHLPHLDRSLTPLLLLALQQVVSSLLLVYFLHLLIHPIDEADLVPLLSFFAEGQCLLDD